MEPRGGADTMARELEGERATRARAGDEAAFAKVVVRYQRPVYGLCVRYLRGPDAEDAAQETFVKAFVHIGDFDPARPLLPWLLTIARRLCIDRLRKHKTDPDTEAASRAIDDVTPSAEAQASTHEQLALLALAMKDLPDGQREALTLFHVEGMTYKDIATALEVPIGTVMTWLHRGRGQLRAVIEAGGSSPRRPQARHGVSP